jgi:hypothetical protein
MPRTSLLAVATFIFLTTSALAQDVTPQDVTPQDALAQNDPAQNIRAQDARTQLATVSSAPKLPLWEIGRASCRERV